MNVICELIVGYLHQTQLYDWANAFNRNAFQLLLLRITLNENDIKCEDIMNIEVMRRDYPEIYYNYVDKNYIYYNIRMNNLMSMNDKVDSLLYLEGDGEFKSSFNLYKENYMDNTFQIKITEYYNNILHLYDSTTNIVRKFSSGINVFSKNGFVNVTINNLNIAKICLRTCTLFFIKHRDVNSWASLVFFPKLIDYI